MVIAFCIKIGYRNDRYWRTVERFKFAGHGGIQVVALIAMFVVTYRSVVVPYRHLIHRLVVHCAADALTIGHNDILSM